MSGTDLELLRRYASARDAEAFAELVARHRDMVYAACYRVLAHRADAEDSTQECFLRLARSAGAVRTSVGGWLHRVAVRTSMAVRRKQRTRRRAEREAAAMPDAPADASWDDIKAEVDRAIDRLPDRLREPLVLHFLAGKPQTAIAEQLGLSQASVSRRVKEGVEELRRHLKGSGVIVSGTGLAGLLASQTGEAAPAALVAELGKIALAGVGSGSAQATGAGLGLGAVLTSKSTIACTVVTALAVVAAVQYGAKNPAASRRPATGAQAIRATVLPDTMPRRPPLAAQTSSAGERRPASPGTTQAETTAAQRPGGTRGTQRSPADGSSQSLSTLNVSAGPKQLGPADTPGPVAATLVAQAPAGERQPVADAPATDMTDPAAVVRAYTEACERADVEAALALTDLDQEMRGVVGGYVAGLELWRSDFGTRAATEYLLLPLVPGIGRAVKQSTLEGDTARVTARAEAPELTFILARQEDGTWRIDLEASILATTHEAASVVFTDARKILGPKRIDWRVREALYRAGRHVIRYARETGRYPKAESWMDDVEAHCMVLGAFDVSDVLSEEYGLAMNASLSGLPYDENWPARRQIVGLFTSGDTSRNASGDPDLELADNDEGVEGVGMWLASEEVVTVPHGMSVAEAVLSIDHQEVSRRRIETILKALLSYARDNEAKLPPADSWCDLVLLYAAAGQDVDELFWCPATPELDYAWAINRDLAGKDIRQVPNHDQQVLLLPAEAGVRNEACAVPDTVEEGRYLAPWNEGPRLAVRVGMLDGETRLVPEGAPYPRPPAAKP